MNLFDLFFRLHGDILSLWLSMIEFNDTYERLYTSSKSSHAYHTSSLDLSNFLEYIKYFWDISSISALTEKVYLHKKSYRIAQDIMASKSQNESFHGSARLSY